MNKKMIVGIIIVAGIAIGLLAMHTPMKLANVSPLDVGSGNSAADGPHPTDPSNWQVIYPSTNLLDGPHPTDPSNW